MKYNPEKLAQLDALYDEWSGCTRCHCSEFRENIVFGYGNPDAQVMIIGEAPWRDEDAQGLPFVGQSGRLLDTILAGVSVNEELSGESSTEDAKEVRNLLLDEYYYCNTIMCLPGPLANGPCTPSAAAIRTCKERLYKQIYIVDPMIIVAAGVTAAKALTSSRETLGELRGEVRDIRVPGNNMTLSYPLYTIYHPSFLLRMGVAAVGGEYDENFNHMLRVWEIADLLAWHNFGNPRPKRHDYVVCTPEQARELEETKAKAKAKRKAGEESKIEAEGGLDDEAERLEEDEDDATEDTEDDEDEDDAEEDDQ